MFRSQGGAVLSHGRFSRISPACTSHRRCRAYKVHMATPAAVTAVIRAHKPVFKSQHDKVAFAIHAILSVNGFTLQAVGPTADDVAEHGRTSSAMEEAPLDGWDASSSDTQGGHYAFLYAVPDQGSTSSASGAGQAGSATPSTTAGTQLLVKAVIMGSQLLASFCRVPCQPDQAPESLELDVQAYAGESCTGPPAYAYSHLDQLVQRVQSALASQADDAGGTHGARTAGAKSQAQPAPAAAQPAGGKEEPPAAADPLRNERFRPLPRNPLMVGEGDLEPGMLPMPGGRHGFDPLEGALPGRHGLGPAGGMHMGPGHPVFGGGLPGGPGVGRLPPGMGPPGQPGMRWDPIAPPGLPGFRPGDFRPGGPGRGGPGNIDPDIMQPGPGRGQDWDQMFG